MCEERSARSRSEPRSQASITPIWIGAPLIQIRRFGPSINIFDSVRADESHRGQTGPASSGKAQAALFDHGGRRRTHERIREFPCNLGELSIWRDHMYGQGRELEIGNATSAVLISLLQTLVDKGVVSNIEVRALLSKAIAGRRDPASPTDT